MTAPAPVTAETITDEQIRELAADADLWCQPAGEGPGSGLMNDVFMIALSKCDQHSALTRRCRARCAAAWNARHGGGR